MKPKLLLILIGLVVTITQYSYSQDNNFWTSANEGKPSGKRDDQTIDKKHHFHLDLQSFKKEALTVISKGLKAGTPDLIISFPTSDGQIKRFSVSEAPVLPFELSEKYPGIYSYAGRGVDDPSVTIRFSLSDYNGISGIILGSEKTSFIAPATKGDMENYVVYEVPDSSFIFKCETSELGRKTEPPTALKSGRLKSTGTNLRIFRAALLTTRELGSYFCGTGTDQQKRANVLAAVNNIVTQVNGIFERDLGVRIQLAVNNDKILFFDSIPYPSEYLPDVIRNTIGPNNYELGHTLNKIMFIGGKYFSGEAGGIGCVCTEKKDLAVTGAAYPDDPVFARIICHEMGHQMGAWHVQSMRFCASGNGRSEVEPASGSTIMSYAGNCKPQVETAPQGYYNQISIRQIHDCIDPLSCGTSTSTGNVAPSANAGPDYTIPKSTPFILTGQGADPNGDQIIYTWEQNDYAIYFPFDSVRGYLDERKLSTTYPSPYETTGPMFRSFPPSKSPVRFFPNIQTVLTDGPYLFEVLPAVSRDLNFVLTVRDNHPGGGSCEFDSMKVTIDGTSGPFKVAGSFDEIAWLSESSHTISWDVAGTNALPVNCQNVRISLSIDGGYTFPYLLVASTANDGSENVTIPSNISSVKCRIKLEAINNIFYALSDKDFSITCGGCLASKPDSLDVKRLGTDYTTLAWLRGNNSDYELRYQPVGGTWTYKTVSDKSGNYFMRDSIFGLSAGTTYAAQVRSLCDGINTITVRARGVTGQEHILIKIDNNTIGSIDLTTTLQDYTFDTSLSGSITVQYDNDQGSRDAFVDYIMVNGEIRQAEAQSTNTAAYGNGRCGGGSYTEWMNCNGYIGFDNISKNTITIRARGTLGGEHINLRINNNVVAGFNLSTSFQNYTAKFNDRGGITVEFNNDRANSDVVLDYIIVNGETRQAEEQSYNTAASVNGQCGTGSYTEWMHCNGLIGFGNANSGAGASSDWSDTLTFMIPSADYHPNDIRILLNIDRFNDKQNQLDWLSNPDPGTWKGVIWTDVIPKRVYKLDISYKNLEGILDAGDLPVMDSLNLDFSLITALNLKGSSALTTLSCKGSLLSELDLSTQYKLDILRCTYGLVQSVNFGSINQLVEIDLTGNRLNTLDIKNMPKLEILDIRENSLNSLDVNSFSNLVDLNCQDNNLTSLTISNLPKLEFVDCRSNFLTNAAFSNLPVLKDLYIGNNELSSIEGINDLTSLKRLDISINKFTSFSINNLTNLENLFIDNNALTSITGLGELKGEVLLLSLSYNKFTSIDLTELAASATVNLNYNQLNSIVLPSPSFLHDLYLEGNNLTELNLVGQDRIKTLKADKNKLKSIIISGIRAPGSGAQLTRNNLPFTELIKFADATSRIDPMNPVFESVTSPADVTIDYSSQSMIEAQPTTFSWYKNGSLVTTNTTGIFTTTGNGVYYCKMTNGHFPGFTLTSANTTIGSAGNCDFLVPMTSALPSLNKQYTYMHVIGGSSKLGNVNKFTIQWSLPGNGLYDISYNTSNGVPNWYVSLMGKVTHTLSSTSPAMTISGSGISILDGNYWVTMDGDNLVLVSKSGGYAIYCSNSATPPCPMLKSAEIAKFQFAEHAEDEDNVPAINIFPNPSSGNISITLEDNETTAVIEIRDITGKIVYPKTCINKEIKINGLSKGIYILNINYNGREYNKKLIIN